VYKILIIAPSWVGDAVLAQPLFMRLREQHPDLEMDVMAPAWVLPLLQRMPEVTTTLLNPFGHGELKLTARYRLAKELRERNYHQAIVLPNSAKSALIPFLARIPVRTGFVGELRRGLLNDARVLDETALPLMVEQFAFLAGKPPGTIRRPLPAPHLQINQEQQQTTLAKLGLSTQKPIAVFCPGAEYGPAKRWPAAHFAELAKLMHDKYEIWLIGSHKDAAIGEEIRNLSGGLCANLCGKTGLDEAIDLLSCAAVVVSNDSGLMHIAAALDKPMAALYGSSSPAFTPPLSSHATIIKLDLPCSPCFKRECPLGHFNCMMQLMPAQVLASIQI
jgi:heptosyltransferase-2